MLIRHSSHQTAQISFHPRHSFFESALLSLQFANLFEFSRNVLICDIHHFLLRRVQVLKVVVIVAISLAHAFEFCGIGGDPRFELSKGLGYLLVAIAQRGDFLGSTGNGTRSTVRTLVSNGCARRWREPAGELLTRRCIASRRLSGGPRR